MVGDINTSIMLTKVQAVMKLSVGFVRGDNCLGDATHPIMICSPVSPSLWGSPAALLPGAPPTLPHSQPDASVGRSSHQQPHNQTLPQWQGQQASHVQDEEGGDGSSVPFEGGSELSVFEPSAAVGQPSASPPAACDESTPGLGEGLAVAGLGQSAGTARRAVAGALAAGVAAAAIVAVVGPGSPDKEHSSWPGPLVHSSNRPSTRTTPPKAPTASPPVPPVHSAGSSHHSKRPPALSVRCSSWRDKPGDVHCFDRIAIEAAPLAINLEESQIRALVHYADRVAGHMKHHRASSQLTLGPTATLAHAHLPAAPVGGVTGAALQSEAPVLVPPHYTPHLTSVVPTADVGRGGAMLPHCPQGHSELWDCEPNTNALAGALPPLALHRPKLYIENLTISRIRMALSFTPAPWRLAAPAAPAPAAARWATEKGLSGGGEGPDGAGGDAVSGGGAGVNTGASGAGMSGSGGAAAPLTAVVTTGGGNSAVVRLLLSLAHLEGTWLTLKALQLKHPLLALDGLAHVSRLAACMPVSVSPWLHACHVMCLCPAPVLSQRCSASNRPVQASTTGGRHALHSFFPRLSLGQFFDLLFFLALFVLAAAWAPLHDVWAAAAGSGPWVPGHLW